MSQVSFIGRLVSDPETRLVEHHHASSFRLAILRHRRTEGDDAGEVFVDVITFDALAQGVAERLEKGLEVAVTGRLEPREWTAKDGSRRSRLEVVADDVTFVAATGNDEDG